MVRHVLGVSFFWAQGFVFVWSLKPKLCEGLKAYCLGLSAGDVRSSADGLVRGFGGGDFRLRD